MRWTQRGSFRCRIGIWIRVCVFLMFAENALFHIWDFYLLVSFRSERKRLHNIDFDVYLIRIFFANTQPHKHQIDQQQKKAVRSKHVRSNMFGRNKTDTFRFFFFFSPHSTFFVCVLLFGVFWFRKNTIKRTNNENVFSGSNSICIRKGSKENW